MDRHIATVARGGLYKTADHLVQLKQANDRDPQSTVHAHVRRLEALCRAGIVERIGDGVWKVPPDLLQKARTHDTRKNGGLLIELRSHLPTDQQVRAIGATWLDRQLVGGGSALGGQGFGRQASDAMRDRVDFLVEQGFALRQGTRVTLQRDLLSKLREREIGDVSEDIQRKTGLVHRPLCAGERVNGIYRNSVQLVSGRFAMLDDGIGFSLVPWRPILEQQLGQQVAVVVRGGPGNWDLGRPRSISL